MAGRMLNIHPALLPAFKGLETHKRALEAGVKVHGATVHFVVPEMDSGPIIAQAAVAVRDDDTEETLAARVLKVEHQIYPLALKLVGRRPRAELKTGQCQDRWRPHAGHGQPDFGSRSVDAWRLFPRCTQACPRCGIPSLVRGCRLFVIIVCR